MHWYHLQPYVETTILLDTLGKIFELSVIMMTVWNWPLIFTRSLRERWWSCHSAILTWKVTTCAAMTMWMFTAAMSVGKDLVASVGHSSPEPWFPLATRCSCRWYLMPTLPGVVSWLFSLLPTHMREVGNLVFESLCFLVISRVKLPRLYVQQQLSRNYVPEPRGAVSQPWLDPEGILYWLGNVFALAKGSVCKSKLTRLFNTRLFSKVRALFHRQTDWKLPPTFQ